MGAFSLKKVVKNKKMFSSRLEKNSSLSSPSLPVIKASFIVCVSLCVIWLQWTAEEGFNGTFSCYFACLTFCQLVIIFVGSIKHCRLQCSSLKLFLIIVYESRIFIWTSGVLPHCALCLWPCTKSIYEWENEVFFSLFLLKLLNKKGTDIKKCESRRRFAQSI